jgi:protein TonB
MMMQAASAWSPQAPSRTWRGLLLVLGLHAVLFAALYWGLGSAIVRSAPKVVMAQLMQAPVSEPEPPAPQTQTPEPPAAKPLTPVVPSIPQRVESAATPAPTLSAVAPDTPLAAASPEPVLAASPASAMVQAPVAVVPTVRVPATLQASGRCKKPEYPVLSRRKGEQGTVLLQFLIGVEGQVIESKILKSSGFVRLDDAARLALAQCQFQPGSVDGSPEPSWANVKYIWKLQDE